MKDISIRRRHGVVIGGGAAGIAAARALSNHCDRVTVVERDPTTGGAEPRKGAPQGRHVHQLLGAGERALEAMFPGLGAELERRGAAVIDVGRDVRYCLQDAWLVRPERSIAVHSQSRPLLESVLRDLLVADSSVVWRGREVATGLELDDGGRRVTGVHLRDDDGTSRVEPADLVVDASGRGSSLPRWLPQLGFQAPAEVRLGIDLAYASRLYRPGPRRRDWMATYLFAAPPRVRRGGAIYPIEDGRWVVSLSGYAGDHPPSDPDGFTEFARSLVRPDVHAALLDAEPLTDVAVYRFPHARWLRYDRLDHFPAGLAVLGDAVCSLDPVFGQGMTVAALSARQLGAHLARDPTLARPRRLLRRTARIVGVPWLFGLIEDFRHPETEGDRPWGLGLAQRYTSEVYRQCQTRPDALARLLRVMNLVDWPGALASPAMLMRALPGVVRPRLALEPQGHSKSPNMPV